MSWEGFDIFLDEYPHYRGEIEEIKTYADKSNLNSGDLIYLKHLAAETKIEEQLLYAVLNEGVKIGIFIKKYILNCRHREGISSSQDEPLKLPNVYFCDLCGENHTFYPDDLEEGYIMKSIGIKNREKDLKNLFDLMPIITYISNKYSKDNNPFEDITTIVILHFLKDLEVFLFICEKFGLDPKLTHVFYKPYLYPKKKEIANHLSEVGYNVYELKKYPEILSEMNKSLPNKLLIIEDGGYITPLIHNEFPELIPKTIGAIEQTTRGLRNDEEILEKKFPILSVASASIKNEIEPPFVANAVINNVEALLPISVIGNPVALFGYGTIGQRIGKMLKDKGSNVTVYETDIQKLTRARHEGCNTCQESYNTVKDKALIIGSTGVTSIGRDELLNMRNDTYLVSASSDQAEIGLDELRNLSGGNKKPLINPSSEKVIGSSFRITGNTNTIHLLADGFPINFWYSDSMPNQVSDLILSLILTSAIDLCENKYDNKICGVDSIVDKYELLKLYDSYKK